MSRGVLEREERGAQATVRRKVSAYMHTSVATASAGRLSGAPHKRVCVRVSRWGLVPHQPAGWWRNPPH
nr:hypothetical protein [Candidatus Njordarchaeum guaymaensis]